VPADVLACRQQLAVRPEDARRVQPSGSGEHPLRRAQRRRSAILRASST